MIAFATARPPPPRMHLHCCGSTISAEAATKECMTALSDRTMLLSATASRLDAALVSLPLSLLLVPLPHAQAHLDSKVHHTGSKVTLDAYLFAPPNAGNAVFAEAFNRRVNARRLPFIYDLVPQVRQSSPEPPTSTASAERAAGAENMSNECRCC